jgi:hypothetical protein
MENENVKHKMEIRATKIFEVFFGFAFTENNL